MTEEEIRNRLKQDTKKDLIDRLIMAYKTISKLEDKLSKTGWQPIETYSGDEIVDLFVSFPPNKAKFKGLRFTNCSRRADGQWTSNELTGSTKVVRHPSHWMPKPEYPNP